MTASRLELPFGIAAASREIVWNIRPKGAGVAHCLVYGPTGRGKTQTLQTLAWAAMDRGHIVCIIDAKADDFEEWREQGICKVATDVESITEMVAEVRAERERRVSVYKNHRRMVMLASGELPSIVLVVDEMQSMLDMLGSTVRKPAPAMGDLLNLFMQGRSAGIHILPATQYPTVDAVGGGVVRNQCDLVVALGALSSEARRLTGITSSLTAYPPGRAIVSWPGHEVEVQVGLSEARTVDTGATVETMARVAARSQALTGGEPMSEPLEQPMSTPVSVPVSRGLLPPLAPEVVARIVTLRADGWTERAIAAELEVSVGVVHKYASRVLSEEVG